MYIRQLLLNDLSTIHIPNKVLVIYGARRIGKTTLLHKLLENKSNYLLVTGEDIHVQHILSSQSVEALKNFVGSHSLLIIDEAQNINNIGLNLKLLVDHCPGLEIIATGSSAFDLAHQTGEPLTGRKITFRMFPLAQMEIQQIENLAQTRANLESRLLFGSYPEVVLMNNDQARKAYLHELVSSYLYKDILALEGLRKSKKITQLLQLLALQIGKEVSLNELGQQLALTRATVEKYLGLLEKCFVIIGIQGFSRNLRKEIAKKSRYYFYDLGIRNAILNHFSSLAMRSDTGELWENYIIIERLKKQAYQGMIYNNYFWRTYTQQEIDWVEAFDNSLCGYEIKWQPKNAKVPSEWNKAYPQASFTTIHPDNYLEFIT